MNKNSSWSDLRNITYAFMQPACVISLLDIYYYNSHRYPNLIVESRCSIVW